MNAQALKCVCAFFVLAMPFVNYIYNEFNLFLRQSSYLALLERLLLEQFS